MGKATFLSFTANENEQPISFAHSGSFDDVTKYIKWCFSVSALMRSFQCPSNWEGGEVDSLVGAIAGAIKVVFRNKKQPVSWTLRVTHEEIEAIVLGAEDVSESDLRLDDELYSHISVDIDTKNQSIRLLVRSK